MGKSAILVNASKVAGWTGIVLREAFANRTNAVMGVGATPIAWTGKCVDRSPMYVRIVSLVYMDVRAEQGIRVAGIFSVATERADMVAVVRHVAMAYAKRANRVRLIAIINVAMECAGQTKQIFPKTA